MFTIEIERDPSRRAWDVWFIQKDRDGTRIERWERVEPHEGDEGRYRELPTFTLDDYTMQLLVEALAEHGPQPRARSNLEGKLEATQRHLADLRGLLGLDICNKERTVTVRQ